MNFKSKTYDELVNSHFLKFLNVSQLSNVKEFYSKLEFALYSGKKLDMSFKDEFRKMIFSIPLAEPKEEENA